MCQKEGGEGEIGANEGRRERERGGNTMIGEDRR